jgi:glycosyltransferase involved in cell wall biosynthesis
MRVLVFGTYDASAHPRIATLAEGLRASGSEVVECNAPLGLDTAARVAMLNRPWLLGPLVARIAGCWLRLVRAARRVPAPDVVVVGYLGHFDVHLARLLFRGVPIVLDHLIGARDTARDRRVRGGVRQWLLTMVDSAALRAADLVAVVVPVGAPRAWFDAARPADAAPAARQTDAAPAARPADAAGAARLRVVFFGLYTPLQGTPVIGQALGRLAGAPIQVTMVGAGQDEAETRKAAAVNESVRWLDWVAPAELPALVAAHDVCLGIFGTGDKARRVVPNKVFQGAAAGCAIVTSDTGPQRRALGDAAVLVPPGDPVALADALSRLARDRIELVRRRAAAGELARRSFAAGQLAAPLVDRLRDLVARGGSRRRERTGAGDRSRRAGR